jgi:RNA polymerase sigma-70 factor (ECF subfamily)
LEERATPDKLTNEELEDLFRRYGFLLRRRCRVLLGDDHAAEDALQEVFVKFVQSSTALRTAQNRVAWMYAVVDRCCLDLLRRRKVRRAEPIELHEEIGARHPGVQIEARNALIRVLGQLTDGEYEVAVLAYVDGQSQTDIAAALGLSRPTIYKRLIAIRERVAHLLGGPSS